MYFPLRQAVSEEKRESFRVIVVFVVVGVGNGPRSKRQMHEEGTVPHTGREESGISDSKNHFNVTRAVL